MPPSKTLAVRFTDPCACLQVDVLKGEKEVLEESAAAANAKMQETREAMAVQTKQLGQLQYLPPRLQDMQEQVSSKLHPAVLVPDCASTCSNANYRLETILATKDDGTLLHGYLYCVSH